MEQSLLFLVIGIGIGYLLPKVKKTSPSESVEETIPTASAVQSVVQPQVVVDNSNIKLQTNKDNKKVIAAITAAIAYHTQS